MELRKRRPPAGARRLIRFVKAVARFVSPERLFGSAVLTLLVAMRILDPAPVEILRLKTFDFFQQLQPREGGPRPVAIVDIDDASLESVGQWPWPRHIVAEMIDNLTDLGAIVVGLDIIFAEPDRTSPDLIAKSLPELSASARAEIARARNHDEIMADTMLRARVVLGLSAYNPSEGAGLRAKVEPMARPAVLGGNAEPYLLQFPNPLGNIPALEEATSGRGMLTIRPDPDGIVRRVPLVMLAGEDIMPALSLEALRVATDEKNYLIRMDESGLKDVVVARTPIPTDRNGFFWVYYTPHEQGRFVSAKAVLDKAVPVERIAGKIVLVGTSATGLLDIKATPLDAAMPGVEVHAQVLENILSGAILKRPGWALGAELVGLVFAGILLIVLMPFVGAIAALIGGVVLSAAAVGTAWYLFIDRGVLLDALYPLLASATLFWTLVFWNYAREERQKAQIRSAFGQYISPDLVEELAGDPSRLVLGGQTLDMTVLFSDVRGFTAISELYRDNPQGLTQLMNQFLTPLSNAIASRRGTIDKYMGDAIMAFWNAPLPNPDHASRALYAALEMQAEVETLNVTRKREAEESGGTFLSLDVGIGINTGTCMVGNMGSDMRFDYTVLGDTVNVASRLEGQSRVYGSRIILGENTVREAGDGFATLELDLIRVKGKEEPERVFALLGAADLATSEAFTTLDELNSAMLDAYRSADWSGAEKKAREARAAGEPFGLNTLYDMYLGRIAAFAADPPGEDWDGVFTATSK